MRVTKSRLVDAWHVDTKHHFNIIIMNCRTFHHGRLGTVPCEIGYVDKKSTHEMSFLVVLSRYIRLHSRYLQGNAKEVTTHRCEHLLR